MVEAKRLAPLAVFILECCLAVGGLGALQFHFVTVIFGSNDFSMY
jgi:uncharacterized membrane protein YuzA (DUF378 family)